MISATNTGRCPPVDHRRMADQRHALAPLHRQLGYCAHGSPLVGADDVDEISDANARFVRTKAADRILQTGFWNIPAAAVAARDGSLPSARSRETP